MSFVPKKGLREVGGLHAGSIQDILLNRKSVSVSSKVVADRGIEPTLSRVMSPAQLPRLLIRYVWLLSKDSNLRLEVISFGLCH